MFLLFILFKFNLYLLLIRSNEGKQNIDDHENRENCLERFDSWNPKWPHENKEERVLEEANQVNKANEDIPRHLGL